MLKQSFPQNQPAINLTSVVSACAVALRTARGRPVCSEPAAGCRKEAVSLPLPRLPLPQPPEPKLGTDTALCHNPPPKLESRER